LDYGAVRGFFGPRGGARWSRDEARLRLEPTVSAPAYDVTLVMGSPEPSPFANPEVALRTNAGASARFHVTREMQPYTFRSVAPPRGQLVVVLESPTWIGAGQPPEQGV